MLYNKKSQDVQVYFTICIYLLTTSLDYHALIFMDLLLTTSLLSLLLFSTYVTSLISLLSSSYLESLVTLTNNDTYSLYTKQFQQIINFSMLGSSILWVAVYCSQQRIKLNRTFTINNKISLYGKVNISF